MIRYLYSRDGSLFREKRMLRMAPDQQEQIRQLQEQNAALQKKVEELKTTVERLEKSMNSTKKVVNGPNFPVRQNGVVLPRAAQNSPAARDPRMQARMRQMASVRNLDALLHVIPLEYRSGEKVLRVKPIPQPWTPEERENIYEPTHPTLGRIRFVKQDGQWAYDGIVMTPEDLRNDQLRIQQKYADQENEKRERDRMLQINLNRARAGQPLPKDMEKDYETDRYLEQVVRGQIPPQQYDENNIYNRPGYTFIPNSIASRDAARGNRPQSVPSVSVGRVYEVDDRSTEEFRADLKKKVEVKMARINSSVESRKYDVPRIPNQTMSVTFPGTLLGYKGNARGEILFKPREGVFADARSEMIAKQIGVTFLTGPDGLQNNMSSVEVFFANEGVYTVQTKKTLYTDAGPVDTIDVKIDRAQMAIEQQKLKEAMARPNPDIWGIIPSGIKDGVGNTFMYRIRNGVLESYTPHYGYTVFNAANGKWYAPGDGVRRQNAEMNVAYAALFPIGQQPVVAKQPQQQPVQEPVAPKQQEKQPVQQQQPVENKQPEKQKLSIDTFKATLDRLNIKVDEAWLKDDTWNKLNLALGSLGDQDYKLVMGRTISMPGTNFPNANGFALPNDPDQDRVNEQLRAYVDFVKRNPAPQFIQKIENDPNEEPVAEEQPAQVQPPVAEAKPVEPATPNQQAPVQQPVAPVAKGPVQPEVKPAEVEKPKAPTVEKNDAITEAQPDLNSLLPVKYENEPIIQRESQLNQIKMIKLRGDGGVLQNFKASVGQNGLLLTRKEESDLREEYKNADDDEKKRLEPVMKIIDDYLTSKVPTLNEELGVPDAPLQLPNEEQVNIIKPTNEQMKQLSDDVVAMGNKYGLDVDAIVDEKNYSSLKNNFAKVEAALAALANLSDDEKDQLRNANIYLIDTPVDSSVYERNIRNGFIDISVDGTNPDFASQIKKGLARIKELADGVPAQTPQVPTKSDIPGVPQPKSAVETPKEPTEPEIPIVTSTESSLKINESVAIDGTKEIQLIPGLTIGKTLKLDPNVWDLDHVLGYTTVNGLVNLNPVKPSEKKTVPPDIMNVPKCVAKRSSDTYIILKETEESEDRDSLVQIEIMTDRIEFMVSGEDGLKVINVWKK